MRYSSKTRGFTLIELLVVISIIGLLSSILLTSLTKARAKGKDAVIISEMDAVASEMELLNEDTGSYCGGTAGWVTLNGSCNSFPASAYNSQFVALCNNIINNSNPVSSGWPPAYQLYNGPTSVAGGCTTSFSWMAPLNNGYWYCVGSSGRKSTVLGGYGTGNPGCWDNP